jgi:hypothetical protein
MWCDVRFTRHWVVLWNKEGFSCVSSIVSFFSSLAGWHRSRGFKTQHVHEVRGRRRYRCSPSRLVIMEGDEAALVKSSFDSYYDDCKSVGIVSAYDLNAMCSWNLLEKEFSLIVVKECYMSLTLGCFLWNFHYKISTGLFPMEIYPMHKTASVGTFS